MPPISMLIKPVSSLCNMRCAYCFYADVSSHRETASYGIMSRDTLETLVRKAVSYSDGACSFGFQGGEPTLAGLEFFEQLIAFQKKYARGDISNSIQTNGYNLDEKWAEFFSKHNFLVGLSLDGTKQIHDKYRTVDGISGTYDRVLKTAEMFRKHNVQYNILCVVNNDVASAPKDVYNALKEHKFLQFIPCLDSFDGGMSSLDTDKYAAFLKGTFDLYARDFMRGNYVSIRNFDNYITMLMGRPPEQCGMSGVCGQYFLIEADGGVYPCDFYVLDEWKLGNVREDSLSRMMKSEKARRFVDISKQTQPECKSCEWFALCRGGCKRYREGLSVLGSPSISESPSMLGSNIHCAAYKEFFSYAYEGMRKICVELGKR